MGSTYLDDFVLNFDLNHLPAEESIQSTQQKYDRLRKSTSWLKSKIISTDFAIQKYQAKKDDYEQSVKAHSLTREELKQVCITYKDASEKCSILENENKVLLANQEVLKQNAIDIENKYGALLSHTNQLQMLVKQLENEKDALTVEKELNKFNNKDEEILVLQKEKDAMLKDLIALKDVIVSKKNTNKKHIKILRKYGKDIKSKGSKILCTSEESDDDIDRYISSQTKINLNEVHNIADKGHISSAEQNFIDNYSDGEVSVDTGRGSSRANSHDKYLNSPDYVVTLETLLKIPPKDVIKQVDVANSPITVYPPRSVATSPIICGSPTSLFEDRYDDYADCFDSPEYILDNIPLSEEINALVEQEKLADCASPVPVEKNLDSERNPSENYDYIHPKESGARSLDKSLFIPVKRLAETNEFDQETITEKHPPRCLCEKLENNFINDKKTTIDVCTSPVLISSLLRNLVDIGTNTEPDGNANLDKKCEFEIRSSRTCDKSICTDIVILPEKKVYVNACTSPIAKSFDPSKLIDIGVNTVNNMEYKYQKSKNRDKSTNTTTLPEKKLVDASTHTDIISLEQLKEVDIGTDVVSKKQHDKHTKARSNNKGELHVIDEDMSRSFNKTRCSKFRRNTITHPTEELRTQEKVCLESNSSKSLHFESTNDAEVQNILNVMKLHNDLISPISNTPSDPQYLKLLPEMNCTLKKIWSTIKCMYRVPKRTRNDLNSLTSAEMHDSEEISEEEPNNIDRNGSQQLIASVTELNHVIDDDIIDITSITNVATGVPSVTHDNNKDSSVIKSNLNKSGIFANKLLPDNSKRNMKVTVEKNTSCSVQSQMPNSSDPNKIDTSNINNSIGTEEKMLLSEKENDEKKDSQHKCTENYSDRNESCEDNTESIIYTNNSEESNIIEASTGHTIIINGTIKTRKKSKLEKFRERMLPTGKIKKMSPPIIKHSLKACNIKPKDTKITASLNQKMAYENAVKVMAELRSNQELQQNKQKRLKCLQEASDIGQSNKIETASSETFERKILSTRSRTRRLSKKEDTVAVNLELNIKETEKSPVNRNVRKRPANTEVDSFQSNCKRILRSSTVTQITNETNNERCSGDSLSECSKSLGDDSRNNRENQNCSPENVRAESNKEFEKRSIRKTKPVIELSECLADNGNLVSIVPGNVGYVDINKNINNKKKSPEGFCSDMDNIENNHSKVNQITLENYNGEIDCVEDIQVTKISIDEASKVVMETKNDDLTTSNGNSNNDQIGNKTDNLVQQSDLKESIQKSKHVQYNPISNTRNNITNALERKLREEANIGVKSPVVQLIQLKNDVMPGKNNIVSYSDLDLYEMESNEDKKILNAPTSDSQRLKENILCGALDRYGVISVKYAAKKVPDTITLKICQKIDESILKIIASPKSEQKSKMNDLVSYIQNFKVKHILAGLMKYLKDPTRKNELFNKIINGPAPPMTKSEVILLYVIESLNGSLSAGFINRLWNNMEHALFQLNRAPEFDVIESVSHFYAVLCRYFRNKSRLRCFMLDAMYCLQFKAVPLIRQCLDVCPGVLPNAHEHMAKTSLVTCLVYLLHFYKCQDKFNRAQDIRNILYRKYQYRFSEWNETMILEIFRKAIMDLRGTHNDKKMLRVALIILCKRHGAKWCQLNIIQNILLPIIEKKDVPERIKQFCILMLGPLLKPFPADRKAQCEIVINQLLHMLKQNTSQEMKEAIYSSLIFMNKHDQERVVHALLFWNPENVSPEFEEILNDFVMEKPLAVWKKLVTRKPSHCT